MSKKLWITIKRGLANDPKHRNAMGECVWLFMHMIDNADWETGICYDWKDSSVASDMTMPLKTLRNQRRKLSELGYIDIDQKQHSLNIIIKNWTNPREYSGKVYNPKQSTLEKEPSEDTEIVQGYHQGYHQGTIQKGTPTLYSNTKSLTDDFFKEANKAVDYILEHSEKYPHREMIPDAARELIDVFVSETGLHPSKKTLLDWISTASDWIESGIIPEDITNAYKESRKIGYSVGRPGSLTTTCNAMAGLRRKKPVIEDYTSQIEKQRAEFEKKEAEENKIRQAFLERGRKSS